MTDGLCSFCEERTIRGIDVGMGADAMGDCVDGIRRMDENSSRARRGD